MKIAEKGYIRIFALREIVKENSWKLNIINPNSNDYISIRNEYGMVYRIGHLAFWEDEDNNCLVIRPICAEGREFVLQMERVGAEASPIIIELSNPGEENYLYDHIMVVNHTKYNLVFKSIGSDSVNYDIDDVVPNDATLISESLNNVLSSNDLVNVIDDYVDSEVMSLKRNYNNKKEFINKEVAELEQDISAKEDDIKKKDIQKKELEYQNLLDEIQGIEKQKKDLAGEFKRREKLLEEDLKFVKFSRAERDYIIDGYSHHIDFLHKAVMYYPELQENDMVESLQKDIEKLKDIFNKIEERLV